VQRLSDRRTVGLLCPSRRTHDCKLKTTSTMTIATTAQSTIIRMRPMIGMPVRLSKTRDHQLDDTDQPTI
jgi:hypothetical protein